MMTPLIILSISATLLAVAAFSFLRWLFVGNQPNLSQRLAEIELSIGNTSRRPAEMPLIIRNDEYSQIPLLNRLLQKLQVFDNLRRLIEQADVSIKVGQLLLMILASGSLGIFLTFGSTNLVLMSLCASLFASVPLAYIYYRRRRRIKLFEEQFPDALDMMSNSIKAGFGLTRAMQLVAEEEPDPIGMEFGKTFEEINLGLPLKEAVMNLTQRIDSIDLKLFVTAILIQRESGGNLTEILGKIGSTIRARFKLIGQIKVFTTQARFSGWILGSLPIVMGGLISILNPGYIMLLFTEPLGQYMVALGVVLQILGFIIIQNIVRFKHQ